MLQGCSSIHPSLLFYFPLSFRQQIFPVLLHSSDAEPWESLGSGPGASSFLTSTSSRVTNNRALQSHLSRRKGRWREQTGRGNLSCSNLSAHSGDLLQRMFQHQLLEAVLLMNHEGVYTHLGLGKPLSLR